MRWSSLSAGALAALCKTQEDGLVSRTVKFDAETGDATPAGRGLKNPYFQKGQDTHKETHTLHPTPYTLHPTP